MTSVQTAFERLQRANPEPDPDSLLALLQSPPPSTNSLQETLPGRQAMPQLRHQRVAWVAALGTFLIGMVFGVVLLAVSNRSGPVGWLRTTPVEIAERYFEAHNGRDPEAAKTVLAVDALLMDPYWSQEAMAGVSWLEGLAGVFEYNRIIDLTYTPISCEEVGDRQPAVVVCPYEVDSVFQQTAGSPPLQGRFFFAISNQLIVSGSDNFPIIEYAAAWNQWRRWLSENYPQDFELLVGVPQGRAVQFWLSRPLTEDLTPELLTLLEERIAEYASAPLPPSGYSPQRRP